MAQTTPTPTSYYGQFQPPFPTHQAPSLESYASQYSAQQLGQPQYAYGDYQPPPARPASPPDPPDYTSVDEQVASRALRRLVSHRLQVEGFTRANEDALHQLELELVACELRDRRLSVRMTSLICKQL
jgi:hypothetical protein